MNFFCNIITLLFLFTTTACKVNPKVKEEAQPNTLISYRKAKGRCMKCPHFSIDILANQTAIYEGKANVPVLGKQVISLSKKQFQHIINQFEQSNYTAFERLYVSRRKDAPRMVLVFQGHEVNTQKSVCPKPLMQLYFIRLRFKLFEGIFCPCTSSIPRLITKAIRRKISLYRNKISSSKLFNS